MTLHKEGTKILLTTLVVLLVLNALTVYFLGAYTWVVALVGFASLVVFFLFAQFFRVPKRSTTAAEMDIVCPADGKVVVIEEVEETEYFKGKRLQVSIFMSPLNVHVQWFPIAGLVKYVKYHPGKYLVAWHPKSSTENERSTIVVEHPKGGEILFRQIAGAVARRICMYPKEGQQAKRLEQFGFIKFGSRVDLFLPLGTEIKVNIDDKVKGSETILATFR